MLVALTQLDDAAGSAAARIQRAHSLLLPAPALLLGAGDSGFSFGEQAHLASTAVHIAGETTARTPVQKRI